MRSAPLTPTSRICGICMTLAHRRSLWLSRSTCRTWWWGDLCGDTYHRIPRASWSFHHGMYQGWRHTSGGWECMWSPEAATPLDSSVTHWRKRHISLRRSRGGPILWKLCPGWNYNTHRNPMLVWKVPPTGVGFCPARHPRHWGKFYPAEEALKHYSFPALLWKSTAKVLDQGVTRLSVNQVGLVITNPTLSTSENYTSSFFVTGHLVSDLRDRTEFKTRNHALLLREGRGKIWYHNVQNS